MKKIILAVSLLTLAFSFSIAQKTPQIKREKVTGTKRVPPGSGLPPIDFDRKGTVYQLAAGIDYSGVRIRTSTGEMPLSDLLRKLGLKRQELLLGSFTDLSAIDFDFPPPTVQDPDGDPTEAQCRGGLCTCTGRKDCKDLGKTNWCLKTAPMACGKGANSDSPTHYGCTCFSKDGKDHG